MKDKRNWAIVYISIVWAYYIINEKFEFFIIQEYIEPVYVTIEVASVIITVLIINKITHSKYFLVSFLSLVIYSIWIGNMEFKDFIGIPDGLFILTPVLVAGIKYIYEKLKKTERISIIKNFGVSALQGILAYIFVFTAKIIYLLI